MTLLSIKNNMLRRVRGVCVAATPTFCLIFLCLFSYAYRVFWLFVLRKFVEDMRIFLDKSVNLNSCEAKSGPCRVRGISGAEYR